ncbi:MULTISPECIES: hypothetical protein [Clostridium]|uniref:Permuted papain-like amidase enzyme, YaeF/YiiX, C92 family n=1 Tax=Clostridium cibarium TaxID=2762247 RepID=A0ABR8PY77_9CLOT|nr:MULTISPECIES: hypothetical protein [Clostridium]MBD7913130.1 hypothetical protein [Clostridium cibarium]
MEKSNIYLVFSRTGTWLSRSIKVITNSEYTHVALSLDSNFDNMYTFGRLNPNNPFYAGLTIENLHDGVYKKSSSCESLIYKIPVSKDQLDTLIDELNKYYYSDIKYKYNFLGLFAVLLDKPWKRSRHYFCSQFVTELLIKSSIWDSPKLPELTRPTDLVHIDNKEIIFQGSTNEISTIVNNLSPIAF